MTRIVIVFLGGFMKNKLLVFLLLLFTMAVSGCGESIFEIGGNDKSPEALDATIKKAFMDKDYDTIISLYSSDNYTYFNDEDVHNYVAALLGKGGFDILNGIDLFFGSSSVNTNDIYNMFYTLIGIDNSSTPAQKNSKIESVKSYFDLASMVCNTATCTRSGGIMQLDTDNVSICMDTINNSSILLNTASNVLDNNTAFVCTLTGGFGTVTNLSNTVNTLAGIAGIDLTNIDITTQDGIQNVVEQINQMPDKDLTTLAQNLTDNDLKDLANTLNTLESNMASLENVIGSPITGADEILKDFHGSNGNFTVQSLKDGLAVYLPTVGGSNGDENQGGNGEQQGGFNEPIYPPYPNDSGIY